ncbi:MAG: hypothetical protein HOO89_04000 [Ferruginibacter sp.]|nr:hypothetical protein [Ferruginibacter sp.]
MSRILLISIFFILSAIVVNAQVSAVKFGKNRIQYKKFSWQYYQTKNFNVYFNKGGQELAKFVAQVAEKELPSIEAAAENSLQRRANIILYNEFADMQQTNIGLESDLLNTGAVTRFVNNKMIMYYDANHYNLKKQIRQGIADIITKNVLFGDDLGEIASNQALLDLPTWLTDGYVAYLGENWSTELDDELKSEILSGDFSKFSKFAYYKPLLAGHAFWYYIEEKYKKENVTYFLYLARIYKNLNRASKQITKLSFQQLQAEFMNYQDDKYYKDIARRKAYPKGNYIEGFDISKRLNYYRFNVNPVKKNRDYVVTQFKKGVVRLILNTDSENKTLLKYGNKSYESEINPSYPLVAWDPKGTRISVIYTAEGHLNLFVYDVLSNIKQYRYDITQKFDQVQDVKYMLDSKTLLLSAVKNGHADIYTFDIEKEKVKQITNDVYDNLDATFVSFPGKTGIIYSSNRPSAQAISNDTTLPSNNKFNIFLITNFGDKPELNQITQLTHLKYGNARFPTPYNVNHFTFVSDENGIANRYAGFFTTKSQGLDTIVIIGDDILRNPTIKLIDSTLRAYKKSDVDSIAIVAISSDSTYTFPLSNYPSSLAESRIAGDNNQVSEVTRQSNEKVLYKIKIDENTLQKRNINALPTEYAKKLMRESKLTNVKIAEVKSDNNNQPNLTDTAKKDDGFFQSEFANEKPDTTKRNLQNTAEKIVYKDNENILARAKLYKYKPLKFSIDYGTGGFTNAVLINRYQTYSGGSGPIKLNNGSPLSGLIRLGTSDLFEDIKINGGFKIGTNLKDNEWLINYQNLKRRLDWGTTYYRNAQQLTYNTTIGNFLGRAFTNLYQINLSYPFTNTKSLRFSTAVRSDKDEIFADANDPNSLLFKSNKTLFSLTHLEYVYDNSINVAQNILHGARAKIYVDWNRQINKSITNDGPNTFNIGFDGRYYHSIFRNFIWAGRIASDFSFGDQKLAYFLGGVDGWVMLGGNTKANGSDRYFITNNPPDATQNYAFESLAVNMRGFKQNIASGNNAVVINSEFRLPVFTTLFDKTINNAFIRNFQLTQFIDLGTAWAGSVENIKRPIITYGTSPVSVRIKSGGIGPFAGGYGFGARSTLLGYFVKYDISWPMNVLFKGKPQMYLSLGLDF